MATYTKLAAEETRQTGYTHKLVVSYTDMTGLTSGSAYSIFPAYNNAGTSPAGTSVTRVAVRLDTQFTFAAGTLAITIGDGGSATRFLASSDLKAASGTYYNTANTTEYTYTAADTIDFTPTCGAGTPATIAAGQFTVFFAIHSNATL